MAADPIKHNPPAPEKQSATPTFTPTFLIGAVLAGDIVFVYDGSTSSVKRVKRSINILGQRILASIRKTGRGSWKQDSRKYSHVMLGLGGGLIIHADGKTVAVEVVSDALRYDTKDASRFQIYRRKNISAEQADKIVKPAMRYYNQRYSFFTYFQEIEAGDTTQFCSRLVSHSYRAAGMPLTSLPDNQVLPMDLYRICQSDAWEDVTAEVIEEALPKRADEIIPPIDLPGKGALPMSEFLAEGDALILNAAQLQKKNIAALYEATRLVMENEAQLAKLVGSAFTSSKSLYLHPESMTEDSVVIIMSLLGDLSTLLSFSQLSSIGPLVKDSLLNTSQDTGDTGLYAGYPAPSVIREMQLSRLALSFFNDLVLAGLGLGASLAHRMPQEEFARFRSVNKEFGERFFAAVEPIEDVSSYENTESLFLWVEQESDRAESRKIMARMVRDLKLIAVLRQQASRTAQVTSTD
jgi:uncharacterized protein YycO